MFSVFRIYHCGDECFCEFTEYVDTYPTMKAVRDADLKNWERYEVTAHIVERSERLINDGHAKWFLIHHTTERRDRAASTKARKLTDELARR